MGLGFLRAIRVNFRGIDLVDFMDLVFFLFMGCFGGRLACAVVGM